MQKVSEAEFFRVVGPKDIHPRVDGSTLRDRFHVSYWEHRQTRESIGITKSDSWSVLPTEFYLRPQDEATRR